MKPLLRADEIIEQLPKDSAFARKTKLALNPDKVPDLEWKRATELNTPTSKCVISYPTFQTPPNILKEGEGGVMGMNRGGERGKSLVELEEKDENHRHIIKNVRFKLFTQKNSNIILFCEGKLNHIYYKYLHDEWKSTKKKECE